MNAIQKMREVFVCGVWRWRLLAWCKNRRKADPVRCRSIVILAAGITLSSSVSAEPSRVTERLERCANNQSLGCIHSLAFDLATEAYKETKSATGADWEPVPGLPSQSGLQFRRRTGLGTAKYLNTAVAPVMALRGQFDRAFEALERFPSVKPRDRVLVPFLSAAARQKNTGAAKRALTYLHNPEKRFGLLRKAIWDVRKNEDAAALEWLDVFAAEELASFKYQNGKPAQALSLYLSLSCPQSKRLADQMRNAFPDREKQIEEQLDRCQRGLNNEKLEGDGSGIGKLLAYDAAISALEMGDADAAWNKIANIAEKTRTKRLKIEQKQLIALSILETAIRKRAVTIPLDAQRQLVERALQSLSEPECKAAVLNNFGQKLLRENKRDDAKSVLARAERIPGLRHSPTICPGGRRAMSTALLLGLGDSDALGRYDATLPKSQIDRSNGQISLTTSLVFAIRDIAKFGTPGELATYLDYALQYSKGLQPGYPRMSFMSQLLKEVSALCDRKLLLDLLRGTLDILNRFEPAEREQLAQSIVYALSDPRGCREHFTASG